MWFGRGILDTIYMGNVYRYMYTVGVYIKRSIYKENVYRGMYIGGAFIGRSLICCWRLVRSSV